MTEYIIGEAALSASFKEGYNEFLHQRAFCIPSLFE